MIALDAFKKQDKNDLVVVVATGGTIAQSGGRAATAGAASLIQASGANGPIEGVQLLQVTSPNITTDHWVTLSNCIRQLLNRPEVAGIVITHGTDTLEVTAFFLDLTIRSDVPVVLVGAMRPSNSAESDGPMNLRQGIDLARSSSARKRGVLVILNGVVHPARDVTKRHSTRLDAFESPNGGPLGLWDGNCLRLRTLPPLPLFEVPAQLPEVPIVYFHVGLRSVQQLKNPSPAGIVWAGTGAGSIPDLFLPMLSSLAQEGTIVVRASRTGAGSVNRNEEVDDDAYGFIAAGRLNPQKAAVLLMLCLDAGYDADRVQRAFDQCSEPSAGAVDQ